MSNEAENREVSSGVAINDVVDLQAAIDRLGSETLLKKVAGVFLSNAPKRLAEIREAIDKGDNKALEMSAHTLVSSMAYLSADDASKAALELEHIGRYGDTADVEEPYSKLESEISRLETALSSFIS